MPIPNETDPEMAMLLRELMSLEGGGLRQDEMFESDFRDVKDPNSTLREGEAMMLMRKRLSPERIHNLGVLYGKPLTQAQIDYHEDIINRDPDQSYMGNIPEYPK